MITTSIQNRLEALGGVNFWSFRGNSKREHGHRLFQYPAMMVPQAVNAVLGCFSDLGGAEKRRVCDPFLGSGTVLTESMLRGFDFTGSDINPLAILVSRVKAGPFFVKALERKIETLTRVCEQDHSREIDVDFAGIDKWFSRETQIELSRIRRAIRLEESLWARRFFWVVLAATVRKVSNSRTTTFKLHIRSDSDLEKRKMDVNSDFSTHLRANLESYREQHDKLSEMKLINKGHYRGEVELSLIDSCKKFDGSLSDWMITSPPYGDNATTVPYGQYSYLPLQWIDLKDIDPSIDSSILRTTHEIDSRSLGGKRKIKPSEKEMLCERSPQLANYLEAITREPEDRSGRVLAFFRDLDNGLPHLLSRIVPGGVMVWTLGNRCVGGVRVPFDKILSELVEHHGGQFICELRREIPTKRMALRNNVAKTMTEETMLVLSKSH